jgi:hypothetical protein
LFSPTIAKMISIKIFKMIIKQLHTSFFPLHTSHLIRERAGKRIANMKKLENGLNCMSDFFFIKKIDWRYFTLIKPSRVELYEWNLSFQLNLGIVAWDMWIIFMWIVRVAHLSQPWKSPQNPLKIHRLQKPLKLITPEKHLIICFRY